MKAIDKKGKSVECWEISGDKATMPDWVKQLVVELDIVFPLGQEGNIRLTPHKLRWGWGAQGYNVAFGNFLVDDGEKIKDYSRLKFHQEFKIVEA